MTDYKTIKTLLLTLIADKWSRFYCCPKDIIVYCLWPYLRHTVGRIKVSKYEKVQTIVVTSPESRVRYDRMRFNADGELEIYAYDKMFIVDINDSVSQQPRKIVGGIDRDMLGWTDDVDVIYRTDVIEIFNKTGELQACFDSLGDVYNCVVAEDHIMLTLDNAIKKYSLTGQLIKKLKVDEHEYGMIYELRDGRLVTRDHIGGFIVLNSDGSIQSMSLGNCERQMKIDANDNVIFKTGDQKLIMWSDGQFINLYSGYTTISDIAIREDGSIYVLCSERSIKTYWIDVLVAEVDFLVNLIDY